MNSRSSRKPRSSISSASSSTTAQSDRSIEPRMMWSRSRPGVATTICAPRSSARRSSRMSMPPTQDASTAPALAKSQPVRAAPAGQFARRRDHQRQGRKALGRARPKRPAPPSKGRVRWQGRSPRSCPIRSGPTPEGRMKFTLSWLKDHLETEASTVDEIVDALTDLGLEVEGVSNPGRALEAFTMGKVLKAEQHPDADRLRVCQVETDEGESRSSAARRTPGRASPWWSPSPASMCRHRHDHRRGQDPRRRKPRHDGVRARDGTVGRTRRHHRAALGRGGRRFVDWLAAHDPAKVDPVIEIAITPNRPDALGVAGIARDLAARGLGTAEDDAARTCRRVASRAPSASPSTTTPRDGAARCSMAA
jgi:hypothetical protein